MSDDKLTRMVKDKQQRRTSLTIPVEKSELGTFISSLLGQPQSVEGEFNEAFDINHEWLINLHEVINQRIYQQANAQFSGFRAIVYFKNRMKRTLTTIEAFKSYKELQQQRSIGVQMEWSYLIQFPNSRIPERQQISFHAKTENLTKGRYLKASNDPYERMLYFIIKSRVFNVINYRIDYTERTWGNDLENLIGETIATATRQETKSSKYNLMQMCLFFLVFGACLFVSNRIYEYQYLLWTTEVEQALLEFKQDGIASIETLNTMLLKTIEFFITGSSLLKPTKEIYGIGGLIGFILGAISIVVTDFSLGSFVVLSEKAKVKRAQIMEKEKRSVLSMIWGYLITICGSVIAGFVYAYLTK